MMPTSNNPNDASVNAPSAALAYTAFSSVFGNYNLTVMPATPGKVDLGFPSIPYLSLEALLYSQAAANPAVSPTNVMSGTNIGEQATTGAQTQHDSTGTARLLSGYTNSV
jgi:hypothetical protein